MSKKVQPSRKGTKAWRRNIDIEDVEEQMEETRKEEMMTGYAPGDGASDALQRQTEREAE